MIKEIESQVKMKVSALSGLHIPEALYHKGLVMIAHDFLSGDYRREMIDFLRRVPLEYFQGQDFREHCRDPDFLDKAEEIALNILNFSPGDKSELN